MTDAAGALSFGAQLRRFREAAGLSQEELGGQAGLSRAAIGALERGARRHPHPATVRLLAEALRLLPDERARFLALAAKRGRTGDQPADSAIDTLRAPSLPTPLTPLLGREGDLAGVTALLRAGERLVTLTGPGGVGKTRLALQVATDLQERFADGAVFVPLAPLADAGLVLSTIAQVVGLHETGREPLSELLQRALRERQLLLLLDNCEHVLAGTAEIGPLLEGCPRLVVLATSRAPLRVRGEHEYPMVPLTLPAYDHAVSGEEAAQSPAVRLFVARAEAARPDFALTDQNAPAVAAICGRLDGLPLALELAAPRVKVLSPSALLARLHHMLPLLTGGGVDAPARQQTLHATIAWSYGLLSAHEQRLFARLSVFAGCSLEAVEAVCNAEGELDVLEGSTALVEQSLLRLESESRPGSGDEPRFGMLQTIREYAGAQLEASREAEETRRRHAVYYLSRAEAAASELTGPEQAAWLERLERDLDNLRAALGWARERGQITNGLRLSGALARFWRERGLGSEGLGWLAGFIARMDMLDGVEATARTGGPEATDGVEGDDVPTVVRARALFAAGWLAAGQGDQRQAVPWLERAVALYRAAGEPIGAVHALSALAGVTFDQGAVRDALVRYHECAALARAAQDQGELARALGNAGEMYYHLDDLLRAAEYHEEALAIARQSGRVEVEAAELGNLGNVARRQGDLRRAATLHRQALELKQLLGYRRQIAITLEDLAALAVAEGRLERAAHLLGAATELRATIGSPQGMPERVATEQVVAAARPALGEEAWVAALVAGRALPLTMVIAEALGEPEAAAAEHSSTTSCSGASGCDPQAPSPRVGR